MRLRGCLRRVLQVLQLRLDEGCLCGVLQDVLIKVPFVVDLVDELVDAGRRLDAAALERLWADDLAVVDDELLVEGRWTVSEGLQRAQGQGRDIPYFCISMVSAASVSLTRSSSAATACGRVVATSSLRAACAACTLLA